MLYCNATYNKYDILISAIYRSPSYSEPEFCDIFEQTIQKICDINCEILIAGVFNIDLKNFLYRNRIRSIIKDNGVRQVVNEYTRVTKNPSTIKDYVITNNYEITSETYYITY